MVEWDKVSECMGGDDFNGEYDNVYMHVIELIARTANHLEIESMYSSNYKRVF